MGNFLDYRLFRIGEAQVTVGSLLVTLAILAVSYWLARLCRVFVAQRLLGRTRLDIGLRYAIGRILGYVIFFLGALIALQTVGINATTLAVFGGALGIGLGFGLQDVVKNFVAGLIVLIERPVQVGDRIEIGDVSGDVVEIRARATIVRTNDDVHLIVPNSKFISDTVTNRSFGRKIVRYRVPVGVAYGSEPETVKEALLAAARRSENVLDEPAPTVWFIGFGDSSLDFELLCWTAKMLHRPGSFASELNYLIHMELKTRGIEIPFPQRDLHIRSADLREPLLAVRAEPEDRGVPENPARKLQFSGGEVNQMNKDELEGKARDLKGRVKESAGVLTENERLEREGEREQAEGEAQEAIGKARRKVGEAIEDLGEKIKR